MNQATEETDLGVDTLAILPEEQVRLLLLAWKWLGYWGFSIERSDVPSAEFVVKGYRPIAPPTRENVEEQRY